MGSSDELDVSMDDENLETLTQFKYLRATIISYHKRGKIGAKNESQDCCCHITFNMFKTQDNMEGQYIQEKQDKITSFTSCITVPIRCEFYNV